MALKPVVVFIHGLSMLGTNTWGQFLTLLESDPEFEGKLDIDLYKYRTSVIPILETVLPFYRQLPAIEVLAAGFLTHLQMLQDRHEHMFLVAHSLGGLVLRKALTMDFQKGLHLKIDGGVIFATPNHGVELASLAAKVRLPNRQIAQLQCDSAFLKELNQTWTQSNLSEVYHLHAATGDLDNFVPMHSAELPDRKDELVIIGGADHRTVVRPTSRDDVGYWVLGSRLKDWLESLNAATSTQ